MHINRNVVYTDSCWPILTKLTRSTYCVQASSSLSCNVVLWCCCFWWHTSKFVLLCAVSHYANWCIVIMLQSLTFIVTHFLITANHLKYCWCCWCFVWISALRQIYIFHFRHVNRNLTSLKRAWRKWWRIFYNYGSSWEQRIWFFR